MRGVFRRSRRLPILTGRFQPTIFGTSELNCCVRNGNRWNLTVIDTGQNTKCAFGVSRILLEGDIPSKLNNHCAAANGVPIEKMWSSPRSISTARLSASQHLHPLPINLVVFKGSYLIKSVGYLIFGSFELFFFVRIGNMWVLSVIFTYLMSG